METCMGSDPATYIVTIFLYFYGSKWIRLKKMEIQKVRKMLNFSRFMDFLRSLNYWYF